MDQLKPTNSPVTYQMVIVMAVPADGAIELARMLYFLPSIARVRVRPMMAAFAVEYYRQNSQPRNHSVDGLAHICLTKVSVFGRLNKLACLGDQKQHNLQIPTPEAVVRILPYFCFWKIGQTALTDWRQLR